MGRGQSPHPQAFLSLSARCPTIQFNFETTVHRDSIHLPRLRGLSNKTASFPTSDANDKPRLLLGHLIAAAAGKSLQSCLTLCDPIDSSPPGFPVPGILKARTLEWVAISFSNAWKWRVKVKSLSRVPLLATPWTAAYQAPLSMGFSRQKYWSGVPLPSPGASD